MSEPVYDEDIVNLGFLKKLVSETEKDINDEYKNVSRHYSTKPQPPYYKGDTWIDGDIVYTCINSREIGLYNDKDWVSESGAKEEAGRKNKIYLTQPTNYNPGDMWILQSDEDHKAGKKGEILVTKAGRRDYSEDDWVNMLGYGTIESINEVANSLNNAINRIGSVEEAIEDGLIVTFYQGTIPEGIHIGDLWYVTEDIEDYLKGKIYRYDGTKWDILDDPTIQKAFEKANEARIVADGKIQSFYSKEAPKEGVGVGDLWIDLGNNNQLYRYNGTNWVAVYDTRIGEVIQNLETVTERTVSIETDLGYITQRVSETEKRIDEDIDVSLTEVKQTVNEINQKVMGFKDFTREKTYITETHLTDTVEGIRYIIDLQIRGDLPFLVPSDDLVPSDTLVPFGEHFTLVLDKQSREEMSNEAQEINIELLEPLRRISDIYDELSFKDGEIYVIRRIGINNDSTLYLLGEPTVEQLGNVNLKTFENDTYIYIKECVGTEIYCKYIVKNDYSDVFATKAEMNSSISQTAEEINSEVKKKVGENEIISKINQTAEEISIDASRININGSVSANGNFKIDEEGNMICNNANINGTVESSKGNIGGWDINSRGLTNGTVFLNSDGSSTIYTVADLIIMRGYIMGYTGFEMSEAMIKHYDLNGDGKVSPADYVILQNLIGISMQ